MRRVLFLILLSICTVVSKGQIVYVCTSSPNGKFHVNPDCHALQNCGGTIKRTNAATMRSKGRQACKICSADLSKPSKNRGTVHGISQVVSSKDFNTRGLELAKTAKGRVAQVIKHVGYTTCYNSSWLIPNWVAYELTKSKAHGTFPRPRKEFEPDPMVKGKSASHYDYSNSGYSRGHMAPAADMKWSEKAMLESFYLSNICPQNTELNNVVWERLEDRCRALANDGSVYICCGPIVSPKPTRIGVNKVAVPTKFFKVLCMRRRGKWQAIGFLFPNTSCKGSMFDYAVSVDEVEKVTGHDFFSNLPDNIEKAIESSWKMKDWQ